MMLVAFLVAPFSSSFAGDKQLTFEWAQTLTPDFYGWKLHMSTTPGGPYTQFGANIVYDGTPSPTYTMSETLTSPDGQQITYYFVVSATDTAANESGFSNEVSAVIDFLGPCVPVTLTVTVAAVP